MKHLNFRSRFVILLLGFLTFGISHAWGETVEIYTNSGSTGTDATSGINADGNINSKNGNPSPSFGCTKADTRTITLTGCDFSKYTNVNLVFDYQMSKASGKYSSFTVTQYDKNSQTIGSASTVSGTNNTSYATSSAIALATTCTKITIVCNPANGSQYGAYVDNIKITGEPAASDPSIEAEDELLLDPEGTDGTFGVTWTEMEDVDVALYTDLACTNKFDGDWFMVDLDGDKNVEYVAEANTAKTARTVYMQLYGVDAEVNEYTKVVTVTQNGAGDGDKITCSKVDVCGSTSYADWKNDFNGVSGAVYKGSSAGDHNSIQLRSSDAPSGIVSTTSGGIITNVKVEWESNTADGRVLNIFGSHDPYTSVADLRDDSKKGTLLGTITKGTSTELSITADEYEYVGVCSNGSAMYLTSITFVWEEPTTATLRFEANGKTLTSGALPTAIKEITPSMDSYTLPGNTGNAAVTGYNWMGWNETATATNGQESIILSDPKTYKVYAIWQLKTTNITLEQDDATTSATPSVEATYSQAMPSATMPQRTGYTFNGYFDAKSDGTKYYNANGTSAKTWDKEDAAFTLHAQWTAKTYNITYKNQGNVDFIGIHESGYPTTHTYDQTTNLKTATRNGYIFGGWYETSDCSGSPIETIGGKAKTDNFTLYAKWTARTTTVSFDKNTMDDVQNMPAGTITNTFDAALITTGVTIPSRIGYTFVGWFDSSSKKYYGVTNEAITASVPKWDKAEENITLLAHWTANVYNITYLDKGGTGFTGIHGANRPTQHTYGTATPLVSPTKEHFDFAGWYLTSDCSGEPLENLAADGYLDNITLYAKWNEHAKFTVTFVDDVQGTDCSAWNLNNEYINTQIVFHSIGDKTRKAPDGDCVTDHYHFIGWVEDGTIPTKEPDNVIKAGTTSIKITKNVTYKAVWAKEL